MDRSCWIADIQKRGGGRKDVMVPIGRKEPSKVYNHHRRSLAYLIIMFLSKKKDRLRDRFFDGSFLFNIIAKKGIINRNTRIYLYIFRHIRFRGIYLVRIFRYENLVAEKMTIHKYNIWKSFFPLIEINNVIVIETLLARFVPCSEQVQSGTTHLA